MASDTAPAAVPGPNVPPPSTAPATPATSGTQQPTDGLAGLLAPVQPTRTAFALTPDHATSTAQGEQAVTDANSAGYTTENPADDKPGNSTKTATGRQERSVIRAWMLAGAERWKKGADARNKRLDIKKARAQARQVKETITVNRAEKTGGGSSNSSGSNSGGKSLANKTNKQSSGAGPKNNTPKNTPRRSNSSGDSGGSGSRTQSGSGTGRDYTSRTDKTAGPKTSNGAKPAKDSPGKTPSSGTSGHKPATDKTKSSGAKDSAKGGGKAGAQGPAGKPGKDAPSNKASDTKPSKVDLDRKTPKNKRDHGQKNTPATDTAKKASGPDHDTRAKDAKDQDSKRGKDSAKDLETPKASKDAKPNPAHTPANTPRPRFDTRTSREAGYRDGTRVGKVVAHTHAYRDGYRDGRTDTAQAAAEDKQRLDKAHADRKTLRTQHEKDRPVTQPPSSADYQKTIPPKPDHKPGPQPVPVADIDATHVHLGNGAARPSISRGEVRTLRRFQQRLADKNDRMTAVAEATRTL